MAFLTAALAKLLPLPSQTNFTRWQFLPDSVGELALVFKYTKPRVPHDMTIVQGDYKLIKDIDTGRIFLFNLKKELIHRYR